MLKLRVCSLTDGRWFPWVGVGNSRRASFSTRGPFIKLLGRLGTRSPHKVLSENWVGDQVGRTGGFGRRPFGSRPRVLLAPFDSSCFQREVCFCVLGGAQSKTTAEQDDCPLESFQEWRPALSIPDVVVCPNPEGDFLLSWSITAPWVGLWAPPPLLPILVSEPATFPSQDNFAWTPTPSLHLLRGVWCCAPAGLGLSEVRSQQV